MPNGNYTNVCYKIEVEAGGLNYENGGGDDDDDVGKDNQVRSMWRDSFMHSQLLPRYPSNITSFRVILVLVSFVQVTESRS